MKNEQYKIYIMLKKNERMKIKIASEKFYCKTISSDVSLQQAGEYNGMTQLTIS